MTEKTIKTILSIAGSDPSGGAGIQADLKTFTALGVYGGAAITTITCQNTMGVSSIHPLSPELVTEQIRPVLTDLNVSHIKIGMVGNGEIARAITQVLRGFQGEVVFDPVLKASSGLSLMGNGESAKSLNELLATTTVLTPNLPELAAISSHQCNRPQEALAAASKLLDIYPNIRAICLKGGHLEENKDMARDYLVRRHLPVRVTNHPRITSPNLHGTGCTYAAAFAAFHLITEDDQQAFDNASRFTAGLIEKSSRLKIGHGNGPLLHHLG